MRRIRRTQGDTRQGNEEHGSKRNMYVSSSPCLVATEPRSPILFSPSRSVAEPSFVMPSTMPPPPLIDRENSFAPTGTTADRRTDKTNTSRVLKKLRRSVPTPDMLLPDSVPPHQLPEDLRKVLEVLENGIFDGHVILSENLRKRYEEQYPLVRSLADVFVSNVSTPKRLLFEDNH